MKLAMMLVATLALSSCGGSLAKVEKFTYYLHDKFVDPKTTVKVASGSGSLNEPSAFGDVTVFDSPLRKGVEEKSDLVGHGGGQLSSLKDGKIFITEIHDVELPDLKYSGSIAVAGRFSFSQPSWKLAITGGTGSFSGASGYFTVSLADPSPKGFVIKYEGFVVLPDLKVEDSHEALFRGFLTVIVGKGTWQNY
ncbi:hypothetical protein R1sor_023779 [Riccia sorocarpa]|uniref:Dirigent protein n=1 Tax=Riccia sorocarpa TaxID=122646 RepID=A0ABD3GNM3_9MARC